MTTRVGLPLLALLSALACAGPEDGGRAVRGGCEPVALEERSAPAWVELGGDAPFAVHVEGGRRPVAGRLVARTGRQRFVPTFPFSPGLTYEVRRGGCRARFSVAPLDAAAPVLTAVHPRSRVLPENILRFYLTFSEPMADGFALDHVRLRRSGGEDLTDVFFEPRNELWSRDRRRLTLLVDPGRVKTGLRAHRALGRAFAAGETYELRVAPGWPSLAGSALAEPVVHRFTAGPEDRERIEPARWRLGWASDRRIHVELGEPVDHRSVERFLRIVGPDDRALPGTWSLSEDDATATWAPRDPGAVVDDLRLVADRRFEDVAGNNVQVAFDHRVGEGEGGGPIVRPLGPP